MERPGVVVAGGPDRGTIDAAVAEAAARRRAVVVPGDDVIPAAELVVVTRVAENTAAVERVVAHAGCPVLVLDAAGTRPGWRAPVVLAVDARAGGSPAAVAFAFAEAARRGVDLTAAYVAPAQPGGGLTTIDPFAYDAVAAHDEADRLLAEAVAGWSEAYPDVVVHRRVWHAPDVVTSLAAATADAGLLVVATRDHPGLSERLLGGVAAGLVRRAVCPLAVVPQQVSPVAG